ncbi:MAG TPA: ribosomal-protein-alanine N-acetyltransferase [Proteiniclasticum sp.]|uniref:ribosomal protein S18-alanine N-acetyltransferase n=1 Tax=Proteiniclasticum sp. TaxID=2053595 RepID=UPI000E8DF7AB|nr:ribosomal protein S18-alanine N-acetyltransferase [Proteiniclasticum sp.]HBW14212.1 ribosomal-protein-alanine N-acetyltransferase [Proteiniclasticum sp.]
MERIIIKEFEPSHVDEVYEISKEAFPLPWAKEELIREIVNPHALNLVALLGDEVVGYVQCWYTFEDADIINIAVKNKHQRLGIGKTVLSELIRQLKAKGIQNVFLEVRVSNLPAQKLYKSFGFITLTKRERYYINGEDALVMNLQI